MVTGAVQTKFNKAIHQTVAQAAKRFGFSTHYFSYSVAPAYKLTKLYNGQYTFFFKDQLDRFEKQLQKRTQTDSGIHGRGKFPGRHRKPARKATNTNLLDGVNGQRIREAADRATENNNGGPSNGSNGFPTDGLFIEVTPKILTALKSAGFKVQLRVTE